MNGFGSRSDARRPALLRMKKQGSLDRAHAVTPPCGILRTHAPLNASSSKGSIDNEDEVARLVTGHGAVINLFNPDRGNRDVYNQQIKGMKNISSGIKQAGITRLLFVGGFGSLEVKPGV